MLNNLLKIITVFLFALLCGPTLFAADDNEKEPLIVFSAGSLTDVLAKHAESWAADTGNPVPRLSFGPSGTLARQVEAGAPAHVMISANAAWIAYLDRRNLLRGTPETVARNSLVLVVPGRHTGAVSGVLDAPLLKAVIGDGRLAMADPAVAPAGAYAREFLQDIGLWEGLQGQLAYGGSARQTLLLAERGGMPALVYGTDARMSRYVTAVATAPVHKILYLAAQTTTTHPDSAAFLAYLQSHKASEAWRGFGFKAPLPAEPAPE